jgi:S-adenosylmethionine:tRNA ribosyltransferase-isomerase
MQMDEFDYDLPEWAIAQEPAEPRDSARLLVDRGPDLAPLHRTVRDLVDFLEPGDLLVLNETRVIPARLALRKETGGAAEVLLLEPAEAGTWTALVRPGRRLPPGTVLRSELDPTVQVVVGETHDDGRRMVTVNVGDTVVAGPDDAHLLATAGRAPLPPYIRTTSAPDDRYQTIYANTPGSVAAPTAGLHLTPELFARLDAKGVKRATVDLVVGIDTFRPVTVEDPEQHVMHSERYHVPDETWEACRQARRVIAVGTTTVRSLESAARGTLSGRTELFLRRGAEFHVVDAMLTNFHLPRSTLLLMIDAFVGPRWHDLYRTALAEGYRFLSFGDAMLLQRDRAASQLSPR